MSEINGTRVILDENMADMTVDTSQARSLGRAARRHSRGFRQNFTYRLVPRKQALTLPDGTLVMHPQVFREMRAVLEQSP